MSHPLMFDDDDPLLARVRALCLALPEAAEKVSHGRPTFFTKRVFVHYGASQRIDGEWVRHDHALVVRLDPGDEPALRQDERFWEPAYLAPYGWLALDLDRDDTDWTEVAELIESSYRVTALRRQVTLLDERDRG